MARSGCVPSGLSDYGRAGSTYLVTPARVEGEPRIVSQQYLGSTAEVVAKLAGTSAGEPLRTQHKKLGDLAAVWGMRDRLDGVGAVEAVAPSRAAAAASVGTSIALATAGPRWLRLPAAALGQRRFRKAMDRLGEPELRRIEAHIGRILVREFDLDVSTLTLALTALPQAALGCNTRQGSKRPLSSIRHSALSQGGNGS